MPYAVLQLLNSHSDDHVNGTFLDQAGVPPLKVERNRAPEYSTGTSFDVIILNSYSRYRFLFSVLPFSPLRSDFVRCRFFPKPIG